MDAAEAESRLLQLGLLERDGDVLCTTRRWRGAMMRNLAALIGEGEEDGDIRVPAARALFELQPEASDAEVAGMIEVLLPVEAREAGLELP